MKEKILNILPFPLAFILITAAIIFLNAKYTNIFKFDFSEYNPKQIVKDTLVAKKENKNLFQKADVKKQSEIDSLINKTNEQAAVENQTKDSIKEQPQIKQQLKEEPVQQITKTVEKSPEPEKPVQDKTEPAEQKVQTDTIYAKWVKDTAKLYEKMDPQKAAKIITQYSTEIARDIIYKMNKKKAAQILSNLDPKTASLITRYWQSYPAG